MVPEECPQSDFPYRFREPNWETRLPLSPQGMIGKAESNASSTKLGRRTRALRILVASNHEIFRRGLCGLIEEQPGWKVCGIAVNAADAVKAAEGGEPDVAVIELPLPGMEKFEALRKIKAARRATEFVVLSAKESTEEIQQALDAGAKSYIRKEEAAEWLVAAIRSVASHQNLLTPEMIDLALAGTGSRRQRKSEPATGLPLTAREKEVLRLLAQSYSNKGIAAELAVSLRTAEAHRANIMRKLGFRALADLVRYAIRNNIIEA